MKTSSLERPKLQLQPRTRPLTSDSDDTSRSSIFGQAKPVDTTAREKEIEERLLRQQQQQPEHVRPSSRGDNHPYSPRADKELHARDTHRDKNYKEKDSYKEKDYHKEKDSYKDKEPIAKKTSKENKGGPDNAWLKGRPRILEKQDETPVRVTLTEYSLCGVIAGVQSTKQVRCFITRRR